MKINIQAMILKIKPKIEENWITEKSRFFLKDEHFSQLINHLSYVGKWFTGIGSAGLAASIAFGISAYTAMQPNCPSQLYAADAISGASKLTSNFFNGSIIAIFVYSFPNVILFFRKTFLLAIGKPENNKNISLSDFPVGILALLFSIQFLGVFASSIYFASSVDNAFAVLNHQSVGSIQNWWKEIEYACEAISQAP